MRRRPADVTIVDDFGDARVYRYCLDCGLLKPLVENFHANGGKYRDSYCKRCRNRRDHMPRLPSGPLAGLLLRLAREEGGKDRACRRAGIDPRTLHRYLNGCKWANFNTADRILISLGLRWDDVWTDGTDYSLAQDAFEREVAA